jgi:ubiquitin C-terminal hydrolase
MTNLKAVFIVVLLSFGLNIQARDYFRLRNNSEIEIVVDDSTKYGVGASEIHARLSQSASAIRGAFQKKETGSNDSIEEIWKRRTQDHGTAGSTGNIATAELELIFEKGGIVSVPIASKTGKNYFTTVTFPEVGTYVVEDLGESFNVFFRRFIVSELIEKELIQATEEKTFFYPDTEVQIADALLLTNEYLNILSKYCKEEERGELKLVILHIHTELDPCPKCRLLWSKISDRMNRSGCEWLYGQLCQMLADHDKVANTLEDKRAELERYQTQAAGTGRGARTRGRGARTRGRGGTGANTAKLQRQCRQEIATLEQQLNTGPAQRWRELLDRMTELKTYVGMKPRFVVEISSSRKYGDAREVCLDEFSVEEALRIPSIIDLRTTSGRGELGLRRLAVLPSPYCIFTHFLDSQKPVTYLQRALVPTGISACQLISDQEMIILRLLCMCRNNSVEIPGDIMERLTWHDRRAQRSAPSGISNQSPSTRFVPTERTGVPIRGLVNGGRNLCYFNSVIQALRACSAPRGLWKDNGCVGESLDAIFTALAPVEPTAGLTDLRDNMVTIATMLNTSSQIFSEDLLKAVTTGWSDQHDAHELLNALIYAAISVEKAKYMETVHGTDITTLDRSIIGELASPTSVILDALPFTKAFTGLTRSTLKCPYCSKSENRAAVFTTLPLPIVEPATPGASVSLADCLAGYQRAETLTAGNEWDCPTCGLVQATKQITIVTLPPVLIVQLVRFDNSLTKIGKIVTYNQDLNLNGSQYRLKSVIHHDGPSLGMGHYTASVLHDGQWYYANDETVLQKDGPEPDNDKQQAYILFYERNDQAAVDLSAPPPS